MTLTQKLLSVLEAYTAHCQLSVGRVSTLIFGGGQGFARVVSGEGSMTLRNYETAMDWFSANWPSDLGWPEGVERPVVDHVPDAGKMVPARDGAAA